MFLSTLGLDDEEQKLLEKKSSVPVVHKKIPQLSDAELKEVEAVFSYGYDLPLETISRMPNIRWIHIGQSGMEYLPAAYIKEKGIFLSNSRGINASNIAEHILCTMLNHARKTDVYKEKQRLHIWDSETRMGELRNANLAVLGLGMAGRQVVKRAVAFDMNVYGMDVVDMEIPGVKKVFKPSEIGELLQLADYVVLTMPLTKDTYHIICDESLRNARSNAYLINTGRGGLVDMDALKKAIKENRISGASLDVFDKEPLGEDCDLWSFDERLQITPHIAGDHFLAYGERMIEIMGENLNAYPCLEKMINKVNVDSLM